jgi:hypothetical protein
MRKIAKKSTNYSPYRQEEAFEDAIKLTDARNKEKSYN